MKVRLFIDFWNFTLEWQKRTESDCDWKKVPLILCQAASAELEKAGLGSLQLEETRVYASYEPSREERLKDWLHNFLDRQPGVRVFANERHWRKRPIHCRDCDTKIEVCPKCNALLGRAPEKTVDARIVTDLMNLAWEGAYDVALLVTSDKDFIPAVECLQGRNFKIVNGTWHGLGNELAKVCWASTILDDLMQYLYRQPKI